MTTVTATPETEQNMIRRACAGDRAAFCWLVQTHQAALYNLCYRYTGNAADAEEASQEAFLQSLHQALQLRSVPPVQDLALRDRAQLLH
jgi:RNA polymerase sigma-70 factor (ECF subfamily)